MDSQASRREPVYPNAAEIGSGKISGESLKKMYDSLRTDTIYWAKEVERVMAADKNNPAYLLETFKLKDSKEYDWEKVPASPGKNFLVVFANDCIYACICLREIDGSGTGNGLCLMFSPKGVEICTYQNGVFTTKEHDVSYKSANDSWGIMRPRVPWIKCVDEWIKNYTGKCVIVKADESSGVLFRIWTPDKSMLLLEVNKDDSITIGEELKQFLGICTLRVRAEDLKLT